MRIYIRTDQTLISKDLYSLLQDRTDDEAVKLRRQTMRDAGRWMMAGIEHAF